MSHYNLGASADSTTVDKVPHVDADVLALVDKLQQELTASHGREQTLINVIKNKCRSSREGSCDNSIGESLDSSSEAYNVLDQTGSFTQDVSQAEANSSRNSIGYREPKAHSTRSNCNPHTLKPPFQPNFHPYFSATNSAPYLDWPSASHLSLPHIQISKFSGDIAEYPAFVQEFKSFVEPVCLDAHRRLLYLKLYLVGEAAEVIKGCNSYYNKQEGYYKAWELLDQRYGDSMLLLKRVKEEILHGPTICISDVKRLNELTIKMNNCKCLFESQGLLSELNGSEVLKGVLYRLPIRLQERFAELSFNKCGSHATFCDLLSIVNDAAKYAQTEWAQQTFQFYKNNGKTSGSKGKPPFPRSNIKTMLVSNGTSKTYGDTFKTSRLCFLCKGSHSLWNCFKFIENSVEERRKLVKEKSLCFNCLRIGHRVVDCEFKRSCQVCGQRHNTLLHTSISSPKLTQSIESKKNVEAAENVVVSLSNTRAAIPAANKRFMNILPIKVWKNDPNSAVTTYALLDSGSTTCISSSSLVNRLGLNQMNDQVKLSGIGSISSCSSRTSEFFICGINEPHVFKITECRVMDKLPNMEENIPSNDVVLRYPHLEDLEFPTLVPANVELLLGANAHEVFKISEQRCGEYGQPYGLHTALGWTIFGSEYNAFENESSDNICAKVSVLPDGREDDGLCDDILNFLEQDFHDLEVYQRPEMSLEDKRALNIMKSGVTKCDKHYQVQLPWKLKNPGLENNRELALKRLAGLKRRLERSPDLYEKYCTKFNSYIDEGHASLVTNQRSFTESLIWYLPHHCTGEKFRIVFDCSAKFNNTSINDVLLQGPDLCNNLTGVLLRFRQEEVAVAADIRNMFHQVFVEEQDRSVLRFLWFPNHDMTQTPLDYQMNVLPFGLTCSPSCASFALHKTAVDNVTDADHEVIQTVFKNFYVDDMLKSCSSVDGCISLISQLRSLLSSGGFHLSKFSSNNSRVLSCISEADRASSVVEFGPNTQKALGLYWCTKSDQLKTRVKVTSRPFTRRGLLSMVSQIFDVVGIIQPFLLPARRLLQEACKTESSWDAPLGEQQRAVWDQWLQSLAYLEGVSLRRCFKLANKILERVELHVFCDASTTGYSAVCYIRSRYANDVIACVFCMGKSRVAPLKAVSVPRLELTAATLAVKLCAFVCNELDYEFSKVVMWTDATIALRYINNTNKRFKTFVANRLRVIHSLSSPNQWRYVPSALNPADIGSRGVMPSKYETVDLWLNGPSFLHNAEDDWPQQPEWCDPSDDEETKKTKICCSLRLNCVDYLHRQMSRFSSYQQLQRATAWWLRFIKYIKWKFIRDHDPPLCGRLTVQELNDATLNIARLVQLEAFPDVMAKLPNVIDHRSSSRLVSESSARTLFKFRQLEGLSPFIYNGVLRMEGRIQNSDAPLEKKHPIILPPNHFVTEMLIRMYHENAGHSGVSHVLNCLRERFWIVRGRAAVRKVLLKCFKCRLWTAKAGCQRMADLPESRVIAGRPPFTATGVDLMGPLNVRIGRNIVKRYVVVFTCMASRAVHLEVAESLEASAFIQAFRRFVSRRTKPSTMFSDNATNFKGAERELNSGIASWNDHEIQNWLLQEQINWEYNVPACSHSGGVWERIIKSIRTLMRRIVGESLLNEFDLLTLVAEVERILNDRPLVDVSTDPRDLTALTPNMLLTGTLDSSLPPDVFMKGDQYRKSWRKTQALADIFWKRWLAEYLPLLQPRKKWFGTSPNLEPGDLVLVGDDNVKRGKWPKAIVEECYPDRNGLVRRVRVRTADAVLVRDIRKLYLLEGHIDD